MKDFELLIQIAVLVVSLGSTVAVVVWRIRGIEAECEKSDAKIREWADEEIDSLRREFDETLRGLREKINQVELDTEKQFISKETFAAVIRDFGDRLVRFEGKLDRLIQDQKS